MTTLGDGAMDFSPKSKALMQGLADAVSGIGKRIDKSEATSAELATEIHDLTEAVRDLTDILGTYAEFMARAADHPDPFTMLCKLLQESMREQGGQGTP